MLAGAALSSTRLLLRPSVSPWSSSPLRAPNSSSLSFLPLPIPGIPSSVPNSERPSFWVCSKWVSDGIWEDPDDGYGSEYENDREEEEEKEEKEEQDRREHGGEPVPSASLNASSEYEKLVKEVELMLEPEEKAILQQNEIPDLSKISTPMDVIHVVRSLPHKLLNANTYKSVQMKWNPFHSLALAVQIPFMDELLEHGIDIDCVDKDGYTALHKAVMGKKEAVISHLLRKGANPHARDRDGATALHHAVQVGAMQTVKLLIKYKVDINVGDNEGWTPLHIAIQSRSRDIAKILLVNGADKTRRNKDGKTPLDLSLCYGKNFKSYDLAKLLKLVPANRDP